MKSLSALTDPVYVPKEKFNLFERLWLHVINDKRDLPFAYLLTTIHLIVLLPAILLFTPVFQGWIWWAVAVPYFYISQLYFKGRFGLMFHCICHRKFFKKKYQWLHTYITWIICPYSVTHRKDITVTTWACTTWKTTWTTILRARCTISAITSATS